MLTTLVLTTLVLTTLVLTTLVLTTLVLIFQRSSLMTRSIALATILLALSLGLPACESTGAVDTPDAATVMDDTGVEAPDSNVDGGPPRAPTLSYMPEGCTYMVSTPTVVDTARSRDEYGAAADPTHVHTSWAGPSESTFAVNWHTDNDTHASSLLIGTDMAAVMAADDAGVGVARSDGHYMLFTSSPTGLNPEMAHEVHVCGLTPSTTYYYRVGGPGHWSPAFEIATAPTPGSTEPFSFGVTGDSRGYEDNAWAIVEHRMMSRAVDFELFSGDAVQFGVAQDQWNQFFEQSEGSFHVQDFMAGHPMMMANGNHDSLAVNYLAQFALPQEVSPSEIGQGEEWYSFDYGNAHFVFLNDTVVNSAVLGGDEAAWLDHDLSLVDRTTTPWIFVMHHQPLYTCSTAHAPDTTLRANWQPIFDRYHVDFVLAGHNHEYDRSTPINMFDAGGGHVAPQGANGVPVITAGVPSGTIYLVAAGAGAPLYDVDPGAFATTYTGLSLRNYVTFEIDDRTLHMTAYNALTDAVIDEFTYTK